MSFCTRGHEMSLFRIGDLVKAKRDISMLEAMAVYPLSSSGMSDQWSIPAGSICARRAMYSSFDA